MRTSVYGPTGPLLANQCGYCGASSPSLAPWGDPMDDEADEEVDPGNDYYLIDSEFVDASIRSGNSRIYCKKPFNVHALHVMFSFKVETLEGTMIGNSGDYLVRGIKGELYPVKREIFEETYEEVEL